MSGWGTNDEQGYSNVGVFGSTLGSDLERLLVCDQIVPGSPLSYELCKVIYLYHPLGGKLAEAPVRLAMSQMREIRVEGHPDEVCDAFNQEWDELDCNSPIKNCVTTSRIYGSAAIIYGADGYKAGEPIPTAKLGTVEGLWFNVLDPLNTSGSISLVQDPNNPLYQKYFDLSVNGVAYHPSRSVVVFNEQPIYIAFTDSAFGYVGRSVYQRVLFPLKSYVQTMLTNDMISQKAGVLVAKMKQAGSISDRFTAMWQGIKRSVLKGARNYNVLSIDVEEDIQSINMQGLEAPASMSRNNILKDIAIGSSVHSKILIDEMFVAGFAEGTEDAKNIAHYLDSVREDMKPIYRFMDNIVQARAWSPAFFERMKNTYPDIYKDVEYEEAFYGWRNSFEAKWPSLLTEPDSEKVKVEETRTKTVIGILESLLPNLDPAGKTRVLEWAADTINSNPMMFSSPLVIDWEGTEKFLEERELQMQQQPDPFDKEPNPPKIRA